MGKQSIRQEIRKAEREISSAIKGGMEGTGYHLGVLEKAINKGRDRVREKDRMWHRTVLRGFKFHIESSYPRMYRIINFSPHAGVVDKGAEFDSPPPVSAILPWVRDHMFIFADNFEDPERAAHAVSQSIYEDGLQGIHFTKVMIEYLENEAEYDLETYVNQRLEKRL